MTGDAPDAPSMSARCNLAVGSTPLIVRTSMRGVGVKPVAVLRVTVFFWVCWRAFVGGAPCAAFLAM